MCVAVCCISESCSPPSASPTASTPLTRPRPATRLSKPPFAACHGRRKRYAPHRRRRPFAQDEEARCPRQHVPWHARTLGRARIAQRVDLGRGPRRRRGRAPHRRRPSTEGAQVRMRFFELIPFFFGCWERVSLKEKPHFVTLHRCVIVPHIGSATFETRLGMVNLAARNAQA